MPECINVKTFFLLAARTGKDRRVHMELHLRFHIIGGDTADIKGNGLIVNDVDNIFLPA